MRTARDLDRWVEENHGETGLFTIKIEGRLSKIRFIENAPYNAQKKQGSRYAFYMITGASQEMVDRFFAELDTRNIQWREAYQYGHEKIWITVAPEYD